MYDETWNAPIKKILHARAENVKCEVVILAVARVLTIAYAKKLSSRRVPSVCIAIATNLGTKQCYCKKQQMYSVVPGK